MVGKTWVMPNSITTLEFFIELDYDVFELDTYPLDEWVNLRLDFGYGVFIIEGLW
jgi:hypothetical protein